MTHFWKYTIHSFLFAALFKRHALQKLSSTWTYSQSRENQTEVTQQSRYDCESKVCQQDGCKIISWTWRPLSPKTLHIFFGFKINHGSADFSSYNCTRSNVHPRSVNRLAAKLFPEPGDLFHSDKAILSRHQTWLSEKHVTSIKILKSDLEKMAMALKENWCCRKKHLFEPWVHFKVRKKQKHCHR